MGASLNNQKPATTNQITGTRPSIIKNSNVLEGFIANSLNGGIIKPIAYQRIMPGTKVMNYNLNANIKMLTPKSPNYQKLAITFKCYYVPDARVWKNSERFESQKGGASEIKISKMPTLQMGELVPSIDIKNSDIQQFNILDTTLWRDCWANTYIPRYQTGGASNEVLGIQFPDYNALLFRGFKAIYNDKERNKEYDEPLHEFDGDNVNLPEFNSIFPTKFNMNEYFFGPTKKYIRGKRMNSYYTDYRTELLGFDIDGIDMTQPNSVASLIEAEKLLAQAKSESSNAQKTDWQIIAEMYGSKPVTENKVVLLGTKTVGLNYIPVNQDTYNVNENVTEEYQTMGTQGAYSYTEIRDLTLFGYQEFNQPGYLHVIAQVSADSVFETGFNRMELNVNALDQYKPELKTLKQDVLYNIEKCGTRYTNVNQLKEITGYKRKFSEYFKGTNAIGGDMTSKGYYEVDFENGRAYVRSSTGQPEDATIIESQKSYQFFETDDKETADYKRKNIWQDYTDILINDNLAIKEEVVNYESGTDTSSEFYQNQLKVGGQNQVFLLGTTQLIADLPIDESIKNDFRKYGEL